MPRTETTFNIVSPEAPGAGPVWAEADSIFVDSSVPAEDQRIPMPDEVEGTKLARGMKLRGFGHIFVESGLDVRPHGLHLVTDEETPGSPKKRASRWD